ncbi:uncharacterized protein FMAN_09596 [Fusarium mangiferae]|uniref:Uncharacterized protein n=1 Tax=Fusarium mangiferae TaxID=192010 RepID=A0A1L7SYC6_FUSMA|nr:uncharacterized protein FMAN_09596 [Fusarium mangiferae]CVK91520.1 uncharacterized protein FMAN_09596 [Fusarium mangiferae]
MSRNVPLKSLDGQPPPSFLTRHVSPLQRHLVSLCANSILCTHFTTTRESPSFILAAIIYGLLHFHLVAGIFPVFLAPIHSTCLATTPPLHQPPLAFITRPLELPI